MPISARKRRAAELLVLLCCWNGKLLAQESAGQAEIGFQHYDLSTGSQRTANISGLSLSFSEFIPRTGIFSLSLSPALSNNQFRTGDDFLRLKGLPWQGQYWNFGIGDFYLPGQLIPVPFTNVYVPQIAARGFSAEATHGGRTVGYFFGKGTITNTPRVVLRVAVPQTLQGIYVHQKIGGRLVLGARYMRFSNDLIALRNTPYLVGQPLAVKTANTLTFDAAYTIAGALKWHSEAAWSTSEPGTADTTARKGTPFSGFTGPSLETSTFTLRANYTFQNASYFPLLGYYLGDRQGPFGEISYRPFRKLALYGSASKYQNNVAQNAELPTFRSTSESAGVSLQLPARFSLNAQLTFLDLSSRDNGRSSWNGSRNQQKTATLARAFALHSVRLTVRDFKQDSPILQQRQRSGEVEDIFHTRHLTLGAGVRLQRSIAGDSRTSLFYRGSAQFQLKRFSAYANYETGNDLQNRTVFATNAISTNTLGATIAVNKDWELQADVYRNNLVTALNPQSIFVLQGQGVAVPGTLAAVNQWSFYFRVSRKIHWGKAGGQELTQYASARAALKGTVEGFVMERSGDGNRPAEGVPVAIDDDRTVSTAADGRFRFTDVPEGNHKMALALLELPAEFNTGKNAEGSVAVHSGKLSRVDLDVVRLGLIQGKVNGPEGVPLENIVIRLRDTEKYTTPDAEGNFYFYNLTEGSYVVVLDEKSLPEFSIVSGSGNVAVSVSPRETPDLVRFGFEIHVPEKPVRKIAIP